MSSSQPMTVRDYFKNACLQNKFGTNIVVVAQFSWFLQRNPAEKGAFLNSFQKGFYFPQEMEMETAKILVARDLVPLASNEGFLHTTGNESLLEVRAANESERKVGFR